MGNPQRVRLCPGVRIRWVIMAFERLGAGPLGYALCHYGDSRIGFRGPKRSLEEPYVAFIGGTMTFGRNVVHPFADRCELALDMEVVNLGCHAAGPDVFLAEPAFLQIANRACLEVWDRSYLRADSRILLIRALKRRQQSPSTKAL